MYAGPHLFPFDLSFFYYYYYGAAGKTSCTDSPENFSGYPNSLFCIVEACQTTRHLRSPLSFCHYPLMVFSLENRFDSGGRVASQLIHRKKSSGSVRGGFQVPKG